MDWHGSRKDTVFEFRRIDRRTWEDVGSFDQIHGGRLELSSLTDLKVQGALDFDGDEAPSGRDLVRIVYRFTDVNGERGEFPLATMLYSTAAPVLNGSRASGTVECVSVLSPLMKRRFRAPYTVHAGDNAVELAAALVESCGLLANVQGISGYVVGSDYMHDAGTSYLEVVNWLLDAAGFASCSPDPYGVVQMRRYIEPTERTPVATFADDERSIMCPEVVPKQDFDAINVYSLYRETEEESVWAWAENVDVQCWFSTANSDEATEYETVSELDGETAAERLANLKTLAKKRLLDNSAEVEHVEFTHAWMPIFPDDAIAINYRAAGFEWRGTVTDLSIDLTPSMQTRNASRRFLRPNIETRIEGGVIAGG